MIRSPMGHAVVGAVLLTLALGAIGGGDALASIEPAGAVGGHASGPAADQPNQQLIAFLRSPFGVASGAAGLIAAGLAWTAGSVWLLKQGDRASSAPAHGRRRRRISKAATVEQDPVAVVRYVVAGVVTSGALLLPLAFSIAFVDVFAQPKTAVLWGVAAVTGAGLIAALARGARPNRLGAIDVALLVFLGFTSLATVLSVDPWHSLVGERLQFQGLISTTAYVVLFTAARFAVTTTRHVRLVAGAILIGAVIAAIYAFAQWFELDLIWSELYKGRVFSTLGQANALAIWLGTATVMALALFGNSRGSVRVALSAILVLVVGALVLTFSRGGYVALAVGVAMAGLVMLPAVSRDHLRNLIPRMAPAVAAAVLTLGILVLAWQPVGDLAGRVASRTASILNASESSNRAHLDLWAVGVRIAVDHPIFGTGPDTYPVVFPRYRDEVLPPERAAVLAQFRPESPHNVYVAIASGSGLPTLVAYVVLVGSCLALGARAARSALPVPSRLAVAALMGAVAVHLVANMFVTAEPATFSVFWIILGTLAGTGKRLNSPVMPASTGTAPAR
jgi:O-antigen ligase